MFDAEERQWWYAGMRSISFRLLETALGPGSGERILDAGCGTGRNLLHFSRRGRGVGIDLSEEALRFCRTRGVVAVRGTLLELPFRDGGFDGISSFDVLYHRWVTDDRAALRELARVLRPGGWLLVRVPALMALWGAHDEAVHSRHRYTRGELRTLLESAGLEVARASYCNSLLLPLLFARRTLDRLFHRHGSDVQFLPAPLETLFRLALETEAFLLRFLSFPAGASVMAVARKPGPDSGRREGPG
ncbi:MAG: class I SAM-dependent methyltransferase [Vicinamibacteria bacterium]